MTPRRSQVVPLDEWRLHAIVDREVYPMPNPKPPHRVRRMMHAVRMTLLYGSVLVVCLAAIVASWIVLGGAVLVFVALLRAAMAALR